MRPVSLLAAGRKLLAFSGTLFLVVVGCSGAHDPNGPGAPHPDPLPEGAGRAAASGKNESGRGDGCTCAAWDGNWSPFTENPTGEGCTASPYAKGSTSGYNMWCWAGTPSESHCSAAWRGACDGCDLGCLQWDDGYVGPDPDCSSSPTCDACPPDGQDVGSCCGVRYLVSPGCETGTRAGTISSEYPPYEELETQPTAPCVCPCDGQPFEFALSPEVGINVPVAGRPGTRANVSNAYLMDYRDPTGEDPKPFQCSDFAWTGDESADRANLASWELALFADNYAGHGLNIVKMRPNFESVFHMFCVVEPQSDEVVACWFQMNGDKPNALPQFVVTKLERDYPGWTQNKSTKIWNSGKPDNWRRTFDPQGMRARFEMRTGYNTANWDISYRE